MPNKQVKTARDVLIEQRKKLMDDSDFLQRQIAFLTQRLEDMRETLRDNISTISSMDRALEIVGVPAFPKRDENWTPEGTIPSPPSKIIVG